MGPFPTGMVATSVFVWGLIWDSVRSPLLATQTASSLTAIPAGSCPTGIVSTTLLVFVSIRLTEPSVGWVTHADPWPTAMDSGLAPRSTEARSDPLSRSMRPTESAPNSSGAGSPPRVSSNGTATAAVTTARATSSATSPRPRSNERGKPARSGAACSGTFGGAYGARRTTASSRSELTRMTRTGWARPFNTRSPPSWNRTPSTRRAKWATSWLARISPGPAWPHSRAARLSGPPR